MKPIVGINGKHVARVSDEGDEGVLWLHMRAIEINHLSKMDTRRKHALRHLIMIK